MFGQARFTKHKDLTLHQAMSASKIYLILIMMLAISYHSKSKNSYYDLGGNLSEERILMDELGTITFYDNRYTVSRRGRSIPQLRCTGGDARFSSYKPREITCRNLGSNGISRQWKCEAKTDKKYRLGKVHVHCEGYNGPGDRYIVKGSCALDYDLWYTQGEQHRPHKQVEKANGLGLFVAIFIIVLICLVVTRCGNSERTSRTNHASTPPNNPEPDRDGGSSAFSKFDDDDDENTTEGYGDSSSR